MNNTNKPKTINYERAKWLALYYLGIKARTESEIRKKLKDKGADEALCDKTVDFLKEYGYINDAEYARLYIKDACNLKKHGCRRIKCDLRMKGISDIILEDVMAELELDFSDPLHQLVEKKAKGLDLCDPKHKNRLVGFLQRRGYGMSEICCAIREYCDNQECHDDFPDL